MTDLIGESVLIEKEEYANLQYKADLVEALLSHVLRNYQDDQWDGSTRKVMDECSIAYWGKTIDWQLDEEENEND